MDWLWYCCWRWMWEFQFSRPFNHLQSSWYRPLSTDITDATISSLVLTELIQMYGMLKVVLRFMWPCSATVTISRHIWLQKALIRICMTPTGKHLWCYLHGDASGKYLNICTGWIGPLQVVANMRDTWQFIHLCCDCQLNLYLTKFDFSSELTQQECWYHSVQLWTCKIVRNATHRFILPPSHQIQMS